jgi:hypothetical protein
MEWNWRHSKYQIQNFIIKLHGKTPYGMFKQCLREMRTRFLKLDNPNILAEFEIFYSIAVYTYNKIRPLDQSKIDELESEFWELVFREKACLELMTTGRISQQTLETIMYMDELLFDWVVTLKVKDAYEHIKHNINNTLDIDSIPKLEVKERESWQRMILGDFEIEDQITVDTLLEQPNQKIQ